MSEIIATRSPDHARAFSSAFSVIWGSTPFSDEVNNLAYFRAMTCFLGSEPDDLADRRRIMYAYLQNDFASDKEDDTINQLYNIIPIEEGASRILRNLCTLYSQSPQRSFSEVKSPAAPYYEKAAVDVAFRQAHKVAKFCNTCVIMPVVRDGKPEIDVLPPDLFRVETDPTDFRKVTALWVPFSVVDESGRTEIRFKVWTAERYEIRSVDDKILSSAENKYKRIPAVFLQFIQSRTNFYGGGLWDLLLAIQDNNKLAFLANNDVLYSAFSVWVATNFGNGNVRIAPNRLLEINKVVNSGEGMLAPPSLESIQGSGAFNMIEEFRENREKRAMRKHGIPESVVQSNPILAPSGIALMIDRQELMEMRGEDEIAFRRLESDFYGLFAQILNAELFADLDTTAAVSVSYVDAGKYIDPAAEAAGKRANFEAGYIGVKDYLSSIIDDAQFADDSEAAAYIINNLNLLRTIRNDSTSSDN